MTAAVRAHALVKSYGDVVAVDGVSFEVPEREVFGILGPNGAGQTTTLEMVEGLRRPDSGVAELLGHPSWPRDTALLRRIGVQLQASAFFERLTAREQLHTFAALYDVPRTQADEWLERVGLSEKASTRTENLSGGQKQRLALACSPAPAKVLPGHPRGRVPRPHRPRVPRMSTTAFTAIGTAMLKGFLRDRRRCSSR